MLTFTYKTRGTFVRQFQQDWETIIRMLKIIRQLHAPTLTNPHIRLQLCHLHRVQLQYFGRYTISIRWAPAVTSEKRSSSGVVVPCAPRFQQGLYEIDLSEVPIENGRYVNPHRRMKYFLQDMFNREADLHSLMNVSERKCALLYTFLVLSVPVLKMLICLLFTYTRTVDNGANVLGPGSTG
jgi:hypothetical protein